MKKLILFLIALTIGFSSFAQKKEMKEAEKAIKKGDFVTAKSKIDAAQSLVANADDKTKAKFYYLEAMTYTGLSKNDPKAYEPAVDAYNKLFEIEEKMGSTKYTKLAKPELSNLVQRISKKGISAYQNKKYKLAKERLHEVYMLSPQDTVFLEYAANAAYLAKDYDDALKYYQDLADMGYTGIRTEYSAKNKETGEREVFESKAQMELMKKAKIYTDFQQKTSDSKRPTIIKNIAYVYVEKGDNEKAIEAVRDARKMDPKDIGLLMTEANIQIKLGNKDEFARLMDEATKIDPNNATLYYNLGVISMEQKNVEKAKEYYRKAIELKPDYTDAYINLGAAILDKDRELVEEMNKNLNNFDKYDKIKAEQVKLYKEAIPVFEKAYELRPDDIDIVRTLMSLYENTEMDAKFKKMKEKYDSMK